MSKRDARKSCGKVLVIATSLLLASVCISPVFGQGWETYRSDVFKFEINYPKGWDVDETPSLKEMIRLRWTHVTFSANTIKVEVGEYLGTLYLPRPGHKNFHEIDVRYTQIPGTWTRETMYSFTSEDGTTYIGRELVGKLGKLYIVCECPQSIYEDVNSQYFDPMIESFQLIG